MENIDSLSSETWHCRPDYGKENVYRIWNEDDNYHDDVSPEMMDRRAALVAAAPSLLDALKTALYYLSEDAPAPARYEIEAAIAKAEA